MKRSTIDNLLIQFEKGQLGPCLILLGTHGIRKTAMQLAFSLLKSSPKNLHGFPEHLIERQILAGSYPNFYEVICATKEDGTSAHEITVDQIHPALHFLRTTAGIPGYRVLLINPADALNRFAANALLKSLEEPPKNVFILLITHQLSSLLPTLRSRCQKWVLTPDDILAGQEAAYVNGSRERLELLQELGGMTFVQNLNAMLGKSFRETQAFAQTIGKDLKMFSVFLWLLPALLYEKAMTTREEKWLKSWEEVTHFLYEAKHLDKSHLVLSCLSITNGAS